MYSVDGHVTKQLLDTGSAVMLDIDSKKNTGSTIWKYQCEQCMAIASVNSKIVRAMLRLVACQFYLL